MTSRSNGFMPAKNTALNALGSLIGPQPMSGIGSNDESPANANLNGLSKPLDANHDGKIADQAPDQDDSEPIDPRSPEYQREAFRQIYLHRAEIPKRLAGCGFKTWTRTTPAHASAVNQAMAAARAMSAPASTESAIIHGSTGGGKTHLAVAILKTIIHARICKGLFITEADLINQLRPSTNHDVDDDDIAETCATIPILLLDDLGTAKESDFAIERIYWIIDQRWANERQTIITTNLEWPVAIRQRYGDRIYSRLSSYMYKLYISLGDSRII